MKRLVVTADDFGAAREVNEAVEAAHRKGVLTAASLMVTGAAMADAVARARAMPSLRVGLHLVLVEGSPVLAAEEVAALVGRDGNFRTDMVRAGIAMALRPKTRRALAAEIEAQFAAFAATGLAPDHVNAHKHFHLHPVIAGLIARIGPRYGFRAARVPFEPQAVLKLAEPGARLLGDGVTAPWARLLARRFRKAGFLASDRVFGLAWSGAMTGTRLQGLLAHLPEGLSEIYLHPATGPYDGSAPGYLYAEELAGLLAAETAEALRQSGAMTGGFADFRPA